MNIKKLSLVGALLGAALGLTACSGGTDPLGTAGSSDSTALTVASQQYYSNKIIAELYAQALEDGGYKVNRQYDIGPREVYLPEMEKGKIDVKPEYAGNLLAYYDKDSEARTLEQIVEQLGSKLPAGLTVSATAEATDQDTYAVTRATAEKYSLVSIGDLAKLGRPVTFAAPSNFSTRPYGVKGAKSYYGLDIKLTPVEDTGGPLTVKALTDGDVDAANIFTASPLIKANNLVVLTDPKAMILPQNVLPLLSKKVDSKARGIIDAVTAKLSMEDLRQMNNRSVNDKATETVIAKDWLKDKGLVK